MVSLRTSELNKNDWILNKTSQLCTKSRYVNWERLPYLSSLKKYNTVVTDPPKTETVWLDLHISCVGIYLLLDLTPCSSGLSKWPYETFSSCLFDVTFMFILEDHVDSFNCGYLNSLFLSNEHLSFNNYYNTQIRLNDMVEINSY